MPSVIPSIFQKLRIVFAELYCECSILPRIARMVHQIECWMDCDGEVYTGNIDALSYRRIIRYADPRAVKVSIINHGEHAVKVYEQGILVLVVPAEASRYLPHLGKYLLEANTIDGFESNIDVTTFRRCDCGDPALPYIPTPSTGGQLI